MRRPASRPLLPVVALLLLAVAALAGCASDDPATPPPPPPAQPQSLAARLAATAPAYAVNATEAAAWWAGFASGHPARVLGTPMNALARAAIASELEAAGLTVEDRTYPPAAGLPAGNVVHAVVGVKAGSDANGSAPERRLAVIAHYDGVPGTTEAAYDNGSGTAAAMATCKALAGSTLRHTLTCAFFDGEEEGTLGSARFAEEAAADPSIAYDAVFGFDMTGLNWPSFDAKLYAWVGAEFADSHHALVNATLLEVLGYPASGAEAFPFNDRNSDEASFAAIHVPTIRFAGMRRAADYDAYHLPTDTVAHVEELAGGRDGFAKGLGAIVTAAAQIAVELDQVTPEALAAMAS